MAAATCTPCKVGERAPGRRSWAKRNSTVRGAAWRRPSTVSVTHDAPVLDDRDPVDDALHLVELVRGEEHRAPVGHRLADQMRELVLQQRVQPRRRLVEDEQVRAGA